MLFNIQPLYTENILQGAHRQKETYVENWNNHRLNINRTS